ncbi:hypothetical protein BDR03DRAFT_981893 [Suillus americanus]|nr:hypothetical protein BDR03DRAFT_981893 [Suillus americanus]
MLRVWTTTGRLEDPHEERCVKESKFISKGILEVDYIHECWERRYTVSFVMDRPFPRSASIQVFLRYVEQVHQKWGECVLMFGWLRDGSTRTSKRQHTGVPPPRTAGGLLPGGAYIPPLLEGWKHKFSLSDLAHTELKKPAKGVSIVKLHSLLDLALTGEDAAFREDVRVSIASCGLFRFFLHLKHVEQSRASIWIEQKTSPWRRPVPNHPEFEQWRPRVALLSVLPYDSDVLYVRIAHLVLPQDQALAAAASGDGDQAMNKR